MSAPVTGIVGPGDADGVVVGFGSDAGGENDAVGAGDLEVLVDESWVAGVGGVEDGGLVLEVVADEGREEVAEVVAVEVHEGLLDEGFDALAELGEERELLAMEDLSLGAGVVDVFLVNGVDGAALRFAANDVTGFT